MIFRHIQGQYKQSRRCVHPRDCWLYTNSRTNGPHVFDTNCRILPLQDSAIHADTTRDTRLQNARTHCLHKWPFEVCMTSLWLVFPSCLLPVGGGVHIMVPCYATMITVSLWPYLDYVTTIPHTLITLGPPNLSQTLALKG